MRCNAILAIVAVIGLNGCAIVSTPMKHPDGRTAECGATGFGLIGSVAALAMRDNCVNSARANGFIPADEIAPDATVVVVKPVVAPKASSAYSGKATLSLPDGWVHATPPAAYALAIDFAKNATYEAYLVLTYIGKNDITDVSEFAGTKKASQMSRLRETTATELTVIDIKGRTAYVADIEGVLPANGIRYHFHNTIVDGDGEVLMLSTWVASANYSDNVKAHMSNIANGLNGL